MLARRKEIISRYNEAFSPLNVQVLSHYNEQHQSSGHLYMMRLLGKDENARNSFIEKMTERGVATNVHYKPLPMHTAYRDLGFNIKDYPHAYDMYQNEITLPLHTCLTDEDVAYVISAFKDVYTNVS